MATTLLTTFTVLRTALHVSTQSCYVVHLVTTQTSINQDDKVGKE